jgi:cell division protein FtsL
MNVRPVAMPLLLAVLVVTSLGVVYAKHQSRKLFVNLQALQDERDQLNIEWGRLLLEQSTWATPTRVEAMARQRLGMRVPSSDKLVIVRP